MNPPGARKLGVVLLGLLAFGCGPGMQRRGTTYADRARNAYEDAVQFMESGDPVEAGEVLRRVRREYGLSRWGWLAELRLADLDVRTERYTQAITAYRAWIRYHPTQPEVVYAHFAIARTYFRQIPNDLGIFLASWERDQSATRDAEGELVRFLEDYGTSQYAPEAREFLRRVREWLARGEIHIAQFYFGRGQYDAAISRYRTVVDTYRGSGLEPEALLRIGETYLEMGRRGDAGQVFQALIRDFPRSGFVEGARRYLAFIARSSPVPPVSSASSTSTTSPASPAAPTHGTETTPARSTSSRSQGGS